MDPRIRERKSSSSHRRGRGSNSRTVKSLLTRETFIAVFRCYVTHALSMQRYNDAFDLVHAFPRLLRKELPRERARARASCFIRCENEAGTDGGQRRERIESGRGHRLKYYTKSEIEKNRNSNDSDNRLRVSIHSKLPSPTLILVSSSQDFTVSPGNSTEPVRVYRRADFECINVKHTGREWTPFEYRGRRTYLTLSTRESGIHWDTHFVVNVRSRGILGRCNERHGAAFAPATTPIAGETLKGTRGIRLAAYVLGSVKRASVSYSRETERSGPVVVKSWGTRPCRRYTATSNPPTGLRDTLPQVETGAPVDGGNKRTTDQLIRGRRQDQKWYVYRALRKLHYDLFSILGTENEIRQVLILLAKLPLMSGARVGGRAETEECGEAK
ncbi:hypothetical protein ALC56_11993 [Trachymyrmex septentrionalis]|uniref:Uncharacterized protein n=1 Tax=Trachymyrmex septentrionalis TaxID=34720 RepID=A0A195EZK6_9HYME|nr:hypothetical protein ALC56_11993 [Trachymyrmex septentrionalis]